MVGGATDRDYGWPFCSTYLTQVKFFTVGVGWRPLVPAAGRVQMNAFDVSCGLWRRTWTWLRLNQRRPAQVHGS
jgi:hypothetical protein